MKIKLFLLVFVLFNISLLAQSTINLSYSADIVSRYMWRGLSIGNSPTVQPCITLSLVNTSIGVWGSYPFADQEKGLEEIDFWISHQINLESFSLTPVLTSYHNPSLGKRLLDFDNETGSHIVEAGLKLTLAKIPLSFSGYYNLHNDSGNNTYFEAGYSTSVKGIGIDTFIGAAGGSKKNSLYYNSEKFSVINLGLKAYKEIKVSDIKFITFVSFIVNPRNDKANFVAGISL